ncbi:pentapeptide repeat-containing protein [Laspinema palackyanum]|uniref:pentapeptide repeat-containing protein n=1 Tax=Laspinema palackyanum TaxID=3231601 RepID=UPI00345C9A6F|nr:pentapeptide repeat-containing protein [Laspinema sp. D2c]
MKGLVFTFTIQLIGVSFLIIERDFTTKSPFNLIASTSVLITGAILAQKALKGDLKFAWIREQAVFWAATGGTSFYGCNLTDACFDGADLPHTDFRQAKLTRASFEGAKRLDLSRLQGTILEQPKVRKLLTSKMGVEGDYTGVNFNGANLQGANLTGAILTEVQALDADFSGATLTDACIQEWNINKNTRFENVLCEKVYLKCTRKGNGTFILSEPKPDNGTFQPGEFEKWIREIQDTVDLIFQKGLNWKAFAFAMTQTAIDNEGLDLSRYQIEHKGDGVMAVKVGVTSEANKAEIHQGIVNNYDSAVELLDRGAPLFLQAKNNQIEEIRDLLRSQWQEFRELVNVFSEANRSISIHGEGNRVYILKQAGDIMETKSEGFNVGGNFAIGGDNMTMTGAQLTLGDLTGQVTNTIQELHDVQSENGQDLVNILTNLQQSITTDPALGENQQKRALKAVETLAKEGKKPPEERDQDIAGMALDALQGISATVGHASKLAEFAEKYLPTLSKLFGLVG